MTYYGSLLNNEELDEYFQHYGKHYTKQYKQFMTKCVNSLYGVSIKDIDSICQDIWNGMIVDRTEYPEIATNEQEALYAKLHKPKQKCKIL